MTLKAPFPYFGGKRRVADLVWSRFGDVANYIEPFCGSAAMLLCRPSAPRIETLNDVNCYVANFWRAVQRDPAAVAAYADGPVNEVDLHARHRWLVLSPAAARFRRRMLTDPDYFDAKVAGWWVWGHCCWIGAGWCECESESAKWKQRPDLGGWNGATGSRGVHSQGRLKKQLPHLSGEGSCGRGIHASAGHRRPKLAGQGERDYGSGVHKKTGGRMFEQRRAWLLQWFESLADRLRMVRVCSGSWERVCSSKSVTTRLGLTGVFLDPPYPSHAADGKASRDGNLYATDREGRGSLDALRDAVLAWCLEWGPKKPMRIGVCGYDTDGYDQLEQHGWQSLAWKANGGYGNRGGRRNATRERIWFSPQCLNLEADNFPLPEQTTIAG